MTDNNLNESTVENKIENIISEYIWIYKNNINSKTKTIHVFNNKLNLPILTVEIDNKDYFIKPRTVYKDPFRVRGSILIICDLYNMNGDPTNDNNRYKLLSKIDETKLEDRHPIFNLKQEYKLKNINSDEDASIKEIRNFAEKQYLYCLSTNMNINEYQISKDNKISYTIGPNGIMTICDDLWISRFIMNRLIEDTNMKIIFKDKLIISYSDNFTKKENGIDEINNIFKKIGVLDKNNKLKNKCNLKITSETKIMKRGSIEDHRNSSETDPYVIVKKLYSKIYK